MTWFRRTSLRSRGPMSLGRSPLWNTCGSCSTLGGVRKHGEEGIGQLGHLFVRAPWDLLPLFRPQLPRMLQPSTSHLGTKHSIHESSSEHCIFKPQSWYCVMLKEHESLWDLQSLPKVRWLTQCPKYTPSTWVVEVALSPGWVAFTAWALWMTVPPL